MGESRIIKVILGGMDGLKICLVCSHGGHLSEMLQLLDAVKEHNVFLVTYSEKSTRKVNFPVRSCFIKIRNSDAFQLKLVQLLKHMLHITYDELKIFLKEKPDIIISTGSEIAIPICYLGKLCGKKIIFIESLSRVNDLSRTGRIIYPISTLFLVQWKKLLIKYSKAKYGGRVL